MLAIGIKHGIVARWQGLRCLDVVLGGAANDFDGEDLLSPDVRTGFEDAKEMLRELHHNMQAYVGGFDLPEPGAEDLALTHQLLQIAARRVEGHRLSPRMLRARRRLSALRCLRCSTSTAS